MKVYRHQEVVSRVSQTARVIALMTLVALLLLALACTKDSTGPDRAKTELNRDLIVLDTLSEITVSDISPNSLTIEFVGLPPDINRWNILASTLGGGFLRSIRTIRTSDNSMTIETDDAPLTDAVVSGESDTTFLLSFVDLASNLGAATPQVHLATGVTAEQGQVHPDKPRRHEPCAGFQQRCRFPCKRGPRFRMAA